MEEPFVHRLLTAIFIGLALISAPKSYGQGAPAGSLVGIADRACSAAANLRHPRSLPQGIELRVWKDSLLIGSLAKDFADFAGRTTRTDARVPDVVNAAALPLGTPWSVAGPKSNEVYNSVGQVAAVAQQAMLLYAVKKDPAFRSIALRRLANLANLDPHGITSVESNDLSSVPLLTTLAMGLDLLDAEIDSSPSLRDSMRNSIEVRMGDLEVRFLRGKESVRIDPRSSHGYPALGAMAATALMTSDQVAA